MCQGRHRLYLLATASRPDIYARPAQLASNTNSPQGCDVYRMNDPLATAKPKQQAAKLKYRPEMHLGIFGVGRLVGRRL